MKSPITKFTVAAVVFLAVIVGINFIPGAGSSIALASVIETIRNADCISYDMQIGDNAPFIHDTVYQNVIRRQMADNTAIIDLNKGEIMTLNPETKQAIYIDFGGLTDKPFNYIDRLVNILTELQAEEGFQTNRLQPQETDGKTCIGYMATYENIEVEIWIDVKNSLPVRIIEKRPAMEVTCKNFDFNVEADTALFSTALPEGYTYVDTRGQINFTEDATEANFIKLLEMLAELYDGWFPPDVSVEWFVNNGQDIGIKLEQKYEGAVRQIQAGITMGKGLTFLRFFKGQGQWHYAGNGVKMGQTDAPIFWYQPKDSQTWRVIFGDLHVEDVAADRIEELTAGRKAAANVSYQITDQSEIVGLQEDTWYVKAGGKVEVHSVIDIRQGPQYLTVIDMKLPHTNVELLSAKLGDAPLEYENPNPGIWRFYPAEQQLKAGDHLLELIWEFPLESMELTDYGYKVILQSLVPVTEYKLYAVLEPDCGFDWSYSEEDLEKALEKMPSKEPGNSRMLTLFTIGKANAKTMFGTCGLPIEPE